MKKMILFAITITLLGTGIHVKSQGVAINTNGSSADVSAMLDVSSTDRGMLIPRMTKAQRDAFVNLSTGLLIYQTNNTPGFYFYDGSSWVVVGLESISINDLSDGKTGGNSIFLGSGAGTNDDGSDNENVGVGQDAFAANTSGEHNNAFGFHSLKNNTTGSNNTAYGHMSLYENTTGNKSTAIGSFALFTQTGNASDDNLNNVAVGYEALYTNNPTSSTNGRYNVAIGNLSLKANITRDNNAAHGYASLYYNTTGGNNTASGVSALYGNTMGSCNIGIGYQANFFNQEGDNNTIIGYEAGKGTAYHNKSGNVFLGFQAGYDETGSNKLYIENSSSPTPLIGGDFSTDKVTINDVLKLSPRSSAPSSPTEGEIYVNSSTHHIYCYLDGNWAQLDN